MLNENIKLRINNLRGKIGIYYKDLTTEESLIVGNCDRFECASLIKLPVLIYVLKKIHEKQISPDDRITLEEKHKVPSCGALTHMHPGLEVTVKDLYSLMMVLSDNTATNMLIEKFGMENINNLMAKMGFKETKINRLLFDEEKKQKGIQNYFSIMEIGKMLEEIYFKEMISQEMSEEILDIMKELQRNYIMGYYFQEEIQIAHNTDEDTNFLHDVGIVLGERPFILCLASNDIDPRKAETVMRDITLMCYKNSINE